jgi:hypothetical protein
LLRLPAPPDNAAMEADPPKRKRRWFQFSLRTLIGAVAIVVMPWVIRLPIVRGWYRRGEIERDWNPRW